MPIEIDIDGPEGDAHAILGVCAMALRQLSRQDEIEVYYERATSRDFKYLLKISQEYLGDLIEFYEDGCLMDFDNYVRR